MRNLITIFFLVMSASAILAQTKVQTTSLEFTGTAIPLEGYHVVEVIDQRPNKEYIGQVQKGLGNRKYPLNFKLPIEQEMLSFLQSSTAKKKNTKPLTVLIHQLWVSEKTTFSSEKGLIDITLEFIDHENKDSSLGTFSHFIEKGGLDVTNSHRVRIKQGIYSCFKKLQLSQKSPSIVLQTSPVKLDLSSAYPEELKKGFYISFSSLVQNDPVLDFDFRGDNSKVNDLITRTTFYKADSKKKVKHYAYYTGKEILLNSFSMAMSAAYYLRPHTKGRYLVYVDRYAKQGAAVAFGALGAAASTKMRANILDLATGTVSEADKRVMSELLSNTDLFGGYLASDQKPEDVILYVQQLNDSLKRTQVE